MQFFICISFHFYIQHRPLVDRYTELMFNIKVVHQTSRVMNVELGYFQGRGGVVSRVKTN